MHSVKYTRYSPSLHETPHHCGAVLLRTRDGIRVYVSASDPASTPSDARAQAERALALAHRVIVVFTDVYGMDAARHERFADDLASAIDGSTRLRSCPTSSARIRSSCSPGYFPSTY